MQYFSTLNDEQKKAVADTEGAVLVLAGAGSGKTRVLTCRIAHLILDLNVKPSNILAITFTNKAANEMGERVQALVGESASQTWISTIHSMCVRILRNSVGRIEGYNKNFSIYSEIDRERVLKRIIADMKLDVELYLKSAKYHISYAKNNDLSPDRYLIECPYPDRELPTVVKIYKEYEETLKKSNAMDFDDLILKTLHLLEEDEEVLAYYSEKFHYIHIDEFQDTNVIQYRIAKLLASAHGNIFVVGDDDQSIYGWRGAEIKNILNFDNDFKNVKVYKLEQNYRSTKKILALANAVIAHNTIRSRKKLWTANSDGTKIDFYAADEETSEAEYVAARIKSLVAIGYNYKDFAVLMRINALSRSFEQEFMKYAVPFKVFGGFKFFERKEIKDVTAYLRIMVNPLDDEAVLRVVNTPKRGIGDKSISTLTDYCKRLGFSVFDGLCEADDIEELSPSAKKRFKDFKNLIVNLTMLSQTTTDLPDLINEVLLKTSFMSQFDVDNEENINKRMNIDEFRSSVEEFTKLNKNCTLEDYLASITLSSDVDEATDGDYVSVATIHAVKGLEFRCVFIVGMDETVFPISRAVGSPADMEEERRLMYVAVTRACERLYITRARSRFLYGMRQYTSQSRFLTEVASELGLPTHKSATYDREHTRSYRKEDYDSQPASTVNLGGVPSFSKTYNTSAGANQNSGTKNVSIYKAGKRVKHVKFGVGTIILVKQNGDNVIVDVAFKGVGIKSLALAYAPMELID